VSGFLPALGGGGGNVLQLAAGGLSGVLAMSALIATGAVAVGGGSAASPDFVVSACQGKGFVAIARPGDRVLVTGRSVDGTWYRVFVPGPVGEGWVRTVDVSLLATDPVPVAGCGEVAEVMGTPVPTATPTTVTDSPTVTSPTAEPTTAPTAKTTANAGAAPPATPAATPNVGPIFTLNPPQAAPTTIGTNPLGTGSCGRTGVTSRLKTAVTDADGIASIQLWVQKPTSTSYVRLRHDFRQAGAYWENSIDTAGDSIKDVGTLRFRAVAIDTKGAKTTSKSGSLRITRCDTEATISGGINLTSIFGIYVLTGCSFSIPWRYTLGDTDGLSGAKLSYSITHTNAATLRGTITLSRRFLSDYWTGSSTPPSVSSKDYNPYDGFNTVAWTVTTTDKFGGTTSVRRSATVDYQACPPTPY
jgi:hypothetical protein